MELEQCRQKPLNLQQVLSDQLTSLDLLCCKDYTRSWRLRDKIKHVKKVLYHNLDLALDYIPCGSDNLVDTLANNGRANPTLSLFHRGLELPRWIMLSKMSLHFDQFLEFWLTFPSLFDHKKKTTTTTTPFLQKSHSILLVYLCSSPLVHFFCLPLISAFPECFSIREHMAH